MYGYIYKITNNINNKIYIGKREKSVFDESYWGSGKHISYSIKKHGKENFSREIIEWCDSRESLCKKEKEWIEKLDSRNPNIGYNIAPGGYGAGLAGEKNGMYGKKHTEETKEKMSKSHPKQYPKEFGNKISNSLKGHFIAEETKQKIREKNKDQIPWNKGKKNIYSEETRHLMSIKAKERVISKEQRAKIINTAINRKYHWYSNEKESKKFRENQQPEGWTLGRRHYHNADRG